MEPLKVVVRYQDGKIIKGVTSNFNQNRPIFHIKSNDQDAAAKPIEINIQDLKAIFFVKDFDGNSSYEERNEFIEGERPQGRKIEVKFNDGEVIVGSTVGFNPKRKGVFVFPVDNQCNNMRIFVLSEAVKEAKFI